MGGVGDFLFGGSEDAKQTGKAETLTRSQRAVLDQLSGILQGQLGQGAAPYPGETVAPATQSQQNIFDMVNKITSGENMYGLQSLIGDFDPAATREFFQTNVADPAMTAWQNEILPVIKENYISQNAGSSGAANRAITKSGSDLATSLSQQLSEMLYNNKTTHEANLPSVIQSVLGMGTGVGGQEQAINQSQLTGDYNQWLASQPYNNPWLNTLNTLLGTAAFQPIVQGPTQSSGLMSMLMPAIGSWAGSGFSTSGQ